MGFSYAQIQLCKLVYSNYSDTLIKIIVHLLVHFYYSSLPNPNTVCLFYYRYKFTMSGKSIILGTTTTCEDSINRKIE